MEVARILSLIRGVARVCRRWPQRKSSSGAFFHESRPVSIFFIWRKKGPGTRSASSFARAGSGRSTV